MTNRRGLLKAGKVVGVLLMLGPVLAMLPAVFRIMRSYREVGETGVVVPVALDGVVGDLLLWNKIGFCALPVGILMFILCQKMLRRIGRSFARAPLPMT